MLKLTLRALTVTDQSLAVLYVLEILPQKILSQAHRVESWNDLHVLRGLKLDISEVIINHTAALSCHFL